MCDKDNGTFHLLLQVQQLVLHLFADKWVKGRKSLVHQQDFRVVRQSTCQPDALLHTSGEFVHTLVLISFQSYNGYAFICFLFALFFRHSLQFKPESYIAQYSPVRQQSKMLEYHRHLLTAYLQQFLIRQRCDVPTAQPYLSHRGFVQPVNATHQRRLTTTGEPHYHEHLSFLYFQIGITDSYGTACFF